MTIQQCRYVIEIARVGSFNVAATNLFISQASLSESVKNLEKELNIKIFYRSNRGTHLTSEGNEFIKYAGRLVAQAEFIKDRYISATQTKRLYVSAQHYDFVADVFAKFLKVVSQNNFIMSLKETRTQDVIDDVRNSLSDIGIIAMKESGNTSMERYLKKNHISFNFIVKVTPRVFLSKSHPLAKKEVLDYDELLKYPYIFYKQGENHSAQFAEELSDFNLFEKTVEINDRATLMNLLISTDCYTIGTGIMTSELNRGDIIAVKLNSDENYSIGWIARENSVLSDETMLFVDMLKDFLETYNIAN